MKTITKILITVLLVLTCKINLADEGMWIPLLLDKMNFEEIQNMGLKLSPEEIYSINNASLKDAIVLLDNRSSGSLISKDGLILASHNFALDYIQKFSSVENDLITNGFWAKSKSEELVNPGLSASILISIEDVTGKILPKLKSELTAREKDVIISELSSSIVEKAIKNTHYKAAVKPFFNNNAYYLFVYEMFNDVRLVGAPPVSIGKFGGESDNWTWPRHTADFALFRIYTAPDGKPADYAENNIPYKPKYHIPVSIKGINENEFTMILGYPRETQRYISSAGVKIAFEETNKAIIKVKDEKLNILGNAMFNNQELSIKYAVKFAGESNIQKYYEGLQRQLVRFSVYHKKKADENLFENWLKKDNLKNKIYEDVLCDISDTYENIRKYNIFNTYYKEVVLNGTDLMKIVHEFYPVYKTLKTFNNKDQVKEYKIPEELKVKVRAYVQNVDFDLDKKMFIGVFQLMEKNVPLDQCPELLTMYKTEYNDKFDWFANDVYRETLFTDRERLWPFIDHPDPEILENDDAFKILLEFKKKYDQYQEELKEDYNKLKKANQLYMDGIMKMNPDNLYYPDANSTMRLSFGKVSGYQPSDGLISKSQTKLIGVIEKENPMNIEYAVPEKLLQLFQDKDFGKYGENGSMPVCFLTDNDVTGGSSGSPVLNGNGELVGITFDKNWEGMSGDIIYEEDYQRIINVDIRYVLFIIDKFADAGYLIEEMEIRM